MEAKLIVIKEYREFCDTVNVDGVEQEQTLSEDMIVAKEIEAVVKTAADVEFSLGFSVLRDNPIFNLDNPRDMVREFMKDTFIKSDSEA